MQLMRDSFEGAAMQLTRILLLCTVLHCLSSAAVVAQNPLDRADSVVLERTSCFGTCPAYRLRVSRSGSVLFESRNRAEEGRRESDNIAPEKFRWILTEALRIDFLALPDRIADEKRFCPARVTDLPTATVTIFLPDKVKRVEDYHGCFWAPAGLRELESVIDTVASSSRWVRPNRIHFLLDDH